MTRLPNLTARQMAKAILRAGFLEDEQSGSHKAFYHPTTKRHLTIPMHPGDLPRWLYKSIIKQAGLSENEFRRLL
ncbi:MAG: type II toxin-antitoxin system HicA family toxin [Candidatus Vogelbacteria bacterium]|nr:type II toxin-antitoxin system HicA family toxin [Candidatus Vogelbacteria bacterium]